MYVCTAGVGRARSARPARRRRDPARATASCCPARSASTARRSCSRAASSSSTRTIESDTRSLWPVVDALLEEAGPDAALHARRDPRRRGLGAERARPRVAAWRCSCARRACRCDPAVAGASEILGIDPMYVANEGKLVAFVAPEAADAALAALRSVPGLRARGGDRRGAHRAARDGAGGDELRRQAGDGSAGGRPAAADLLSEEGAPMATTDVYAEQKKTEGVTAHVLWMTTGLSLRGRLGRHDVGDQPEPRGHHHPGDPRHAEGRRAQPGDRLRGRPGVRPGLVRRRGGQARPVRARDRGLARQREDQRRGPLDRLRGEPRERPADHDERVDRPPRAEGGGGRGRRAPAPPTAASPP